MLPFESDNSLPIACFAVTAHADPGVLPRIVEFFAKRGLTPTRLQVETEKRPEAMLSVEIHMAGMERDLAIYIGECMRQLFAVEQVLVSEDRIANVA